jgi:hypothetical protein
MSFEVVSIRQRKPGTPGGLGVENNRFTANFTLAGYIVYAWDLMPSREQYASMFARVPMWVSTDSFEIQAVAEGNPTKDQMRLMVQSLLADRFRLQVHTVTEEAAVIALILDKPGATGPKLRPHSEGRPCDVHLAAPTHAVGVFPPACEELLATAAARGGPGRSQGCNHATDRNLCFIACFIARNPGSPGGGANGTRRAVSISRSNSLRNGRALLSLRTFHLMIFR